MFGKTAIVVSSWILQGLQAGQRICQEIQLSHITRSLEAQGRVDAATRGSRQGARLHMTSCPTSLYTVAVVYMGTRPTCLWALSPSPSQGIRAGGMTKGRFQPIFPLFILETRAFQQISAYISLAKTELCGLPQGAGNLGEVIVTFTLLPQTKREWIVFSSVCHRRKKEIEACQLNETNHIKYLAQCQLMYVLQKKKKKFVVAATKNTFHRCLDFRSQ